MAKSEAYNMDCMEAMRKMPDKYFDLAVVDPPYGKGAESSPTIPDLVDASTDTRKITRTGGTWAKKYAKKS